MTSLPVVCGIDRDGVKRPVRVNQAGQSQMLFGSDLTADVFGRFRTADPFTELALKQTNSPLSLYYDHAAIGTVPAIVYDNDRASTILGVNATTAGKRIKQSKLRGHYEPGKALEMMITCVVGSPTTGIVRQWGYFDDDNGIIFGQDASGLYVAIRLNGSDTVVRQANWNNDKMDGTGYSGYTLDVTKSNIYFIAFEWLGVGLVRMGTVIDGDLQIIHQFKNANNLDSVYMSNPDLPIRYEIENDGTGPASTFEAICAVIISGGGEEKYLQTIHVPRTVAISVGAVQGTYYPVISIRLKQGANLTNTNYLSSRVRPIRVDVGFEGDGIVFHWKLLLNPTLLAVDNASWVAIDDTPLEYDLSRDINNAVDVNSPGYTVDGGFIISPTAAGSAASSAQLSSEINTFLTLGSTYAGVSDQFVLAIARLDAAGAAGVYGAITLGQWG